MDVELALKINKLVHDNCKDVPHRIGIDIERLVRLHQSELKICNKHCVGNNKVALPTDNESYKIAQKIYSYCYVGINDELYIGAKAIPKVIQLWERIKKKKQ